MGKLIDFVCKLFAAVAGVLLIVVTVLIGYVILARMIHISSPAWVTQFTEYALLWITFLGTAWVLGRNRHIAIDLVTSQLGQRKKLAFKHFPQSRRVRHMPSVMLFQFLNCVEHV